MCSVLFFPSASENLKSLLNEGNHFDSLLFIFDGGRRYKVPASSLGISRPGDLLSPLGSGLFRSSPFWEYYLYPFCSNFNRSVDGLCGEVFLKSGQTLRPDTCHIFIHRSRRQLKILYLRQGECIVEQRRLLAGSYSLKRSESSCSFLPISWSRMNELLTVQKMNKIQK